MLFPRHRSGTAPALAAGRKTDVHAVVLATLFSFHFYFFVVGRADKRARETGDHGSKSILCVSILAIYLCMTDNKLNSTTTGPNAHIIPLLIPAVAILGSSK